MFDCDQRRFSAIVMADGCLLLSFLNPAPLCCLCTELLAPDPPGCVLDLPLQVSHLNAVCSPSQGVIWCLEFRSGGIGMVVEGGGSCTELPRLSFYVNTTNPKKLSIVDLLQISSI